MLAQFKRPPKVDVEKFAPMKSRINDLFNHMGDKIRENKTIMTWGGVFAEMLWLVGEVKRLGGVPEEAKEKYEKIAKFIVRVNREQEQGIRTGQFMMIGGKIFTAYRFLVSQVETLILQFLEDEEALGLLEVKLADEGQARISLDLDAGVGDEDEETAG